MPTRARKRRNVDMGRLREALRGPGADTRAWLATARIDDDPDAAEWDAELGWMVDVTFYGGPLDGEGPVACRLGTTFAQGGGTKADPPALGCEVLVAIPDGDPNSNPIVICRVHNGGDCQAPTTVAGVPLNEALAAVNHIVVTPHGSLEEYAGNVERFTLGRMLLRSTLRTDIQSEGLIGLGGNAAIPATKPAVLGPELVQALNTYASALGASGAAPVTGTAAAAAAKALAIALAQALSRRVVLE